MIAGLDFLRVVGVTDIGGYDHTVGESRLDADSRSQIRSVGYRHRNGGLARQPLGDAQFLVPQSDRDMLTDIKRARGDTGKARPFAIHQAAASRLFLDNNSAQQIRVPDERGDKARLRLLVNLDRRADLLIWPPFITAIRSDIVIASPWSWVT